MKKITKVLFALTLAATVSVASTACDEVKNGSVIKNCTVTIGYDGDKTQDVTFELYMNYAPATIEHFTYLAENGYYNDTVVSNLNGYIEFGAYKKSDGKLVGKYGDDEKSYGKIITAAYASGKKMINGENRYLAENNIYGEFAANGIGGNKLDFTSGALVLKRDRTENASTYNTGKATMAITFSTGSYFNDKSKFAILGKLSKSDAITVKDSDGKEKTVTSYDFVYGLYTDYKTKTDGDDSYTYYYFGYTYSGDEENAPDLDKYGRYFMKDGDGTYYYKDESGEYKNALDADDEADKLMLDAFGEKSLYFATLPYTDIVIKSIKIEK